MTMNKGKGDGSNFCSTTMLRGGSALDMGQMVDVIVRSITSKKLAQYIKQREKVTVVL